MVLSPVQLSKIQKFFFDKNYSKVEEIIENFGDLENLSHDALMFYAVSKLFNLKSNKKDYLIAAYYFNKIYRYDLNNKHAFYNLISASIFATNFKYSKNYLIQEYKKNPTDLRVLEGLNKMYYFSGDMEKASIYLKEEVNTLLNSKNLEKKNLMDVWSSYLANLNYHIESQKKYFEQCKELNQLPLLQSRVLLKKNDTNKIKLGFISGDFSVHSVSFFLKPILQKINRDKFTLFALSNKDTSTHDYFTKNLKELFDSWHDIISVPDQKLLDYIRYLNLDILIDLSGLSLRNRINVIRSRAAPTQISWCGYCNTLGIANMDYMIADRNLIFENEKHDYSEKIIYMPKIWNCFGEDDKKNFPKISKKKNTKFTFGSFNNMRKISNKIIDIWSSILNSTNSILMLKESSEESDQLKESILNKFKEKGTNINQIVFLERTKNIEDHLQLYNNIDLALDTFPFPGVTTSFESISMGVPVLTMKGFNFTSRCGESINVNLDMKNLIAQNADEYISKAIYFSENLEELKKISGLILREKTFNSALFDNKNFTLNFEEKLINIHLQSA